jgi:hypothetical protein
LNSWDRQTAEIEPVRGQGAQPGQLSSERENRQAALGARATGRPNIHSNSPTGVHADGDARARGRAAEMQSPTGRKSTPQSMANCMEPQIQLISMT